MGLLDNLFGSGPNDPRTQAMGLLSAGLLRGDFGGGLLAANQHFAQEPERQAQRQMRELQMREAQAKMVDMARGREFLQSLPAPGEGASPAHQLMFRGVQAGQIPIGDYIKSMAPKQLEFGKIDPKDYTPESLRAASQTGDYTQLVPVRKMDVVNNQAVDLYGVKPGTVFDSFNPNQPFNLQGGQIVPNKPFQQYEVGKARAGATNVSVNTEKSFLNELAGGLGKGITDAKGAAQASLGTINTVNRLFDALDSGKVMAGPGTTFRQVGLQLGNVLGVNGKNAQEQLLNTRQAIQSLAQLELDAAQQMKGQGQITEAERSIIRRAASGDIDGMTTSELRLLGGVLDRTARAKIRSYNSNVKPLADNKNAAPLVPFLNVEEPPVRGGAKFLGFE